MKLLAIEADPLPILGHPVLDELNSQQSWVQDSVPLTPFPVPNPRHQGNHCVSMQPSC